MDKLVVRTSCLIVLTRREALKTQIKAATALVMHRAFLMAGSYRHGSSARRHNGGNTGAIGQRYRRYSMPPYFSTGMAHK
jgi:hypothetical protein